MTLLTIVQEAAGSLNQPVPSTVFGSTSGDAVLWRNLAQREGNELSGRHDWQAISSLATFTAPGSTTLVTTLAAAASDYDRLLPDSELVNTTDSIIYQGPLDVVSWRRYANGIGGTPSFGVWTLTGASIYVTPAPTVGKVITFSYISSKWCRSSGNTRQTAWAADTDTALIPEDLMALGLTWRWLRAKGMDYAEEMQTYERNVELAASRDRGMKTMSVGGSSGGDYPQQPMWTGTITV